jgi:ABC-type phosphate/phosphonate transport system permease subunit
MISFNKTNRGGLIRTVIFIIIVLIVLAYFGLNLRGIVASQTFQDNWQFVSGIAVDIWNKYLSVILLFLWNNVISPLLNHQSPKI